MLAAFKKIAANNCVQEYNTFLLGRNARKADKMYVYIRRLIYLIAIALDTTTRLHYYIIHECDSVKDIIYLKNFNAVYICKYFIKLIINFLLFIINSPFHFLLCFIHIINPTFNLILRKI